MGVYICVYTSQGSLNDKKYLSSLGFNVRIATAQVWHTGTSHRFKPKVFDESKKESWHEPVESIENINLAVWRVLESEADLAVRRIP